MWAKEVGFCRKAETWKKGLWKGEFSVYLQHFPECRSQLQQGTDLLNLQKIDSHLSNLKNKIEANKAGRVR